MDNENNNVDQNSNSSKFKKEKETTRIIIKRKRNNIISLLPSFTLTLILLSFLSFFSTVNSFLVLTNGGYYHNIKFRELSTLKKDSGKSNSNLFSRQRDLSSGTGIAPLYYSRANRAKRYLDSSASSSSASSSASSSSIVEMTNDDKVYFDEKITNSNENSIEKGDSNEKTSPSNIVSPKSPTPPDQRKGLYKLEKVQNIRDLSSVTEKNDKIKIRPGCIVRTGHLSSATDTDRHFLLNEIKLKTLIDLRSEKEHHMDEDANNEIYNGYERYYYNKNGQYLYKLSKPSEKVENENELTDTLSDNVVSREDQVSIEGEEQKDQEESDTTISSNNPDPNQNRETCDSLSTGSRHFVSVIDESVYQKGVFRKLSKRKKAAALFLLTGGAVSKRAKRRARSIFIKFINESGLPLLNELLLQYAKGPIKTVLDLLLEKENYPVGLYCTAGKDRTGLLVYLILAALGIDFDSIKADYILSNSAYADMNQKKAFVGALEQNNLDPEKFLIAPAHVIDDLKQHIDLQYGSVEKYLDSIGFSEEKRKQLRKNLLM